MDHINNRDCMAYVRKLGPQQKMLMWLYWIQQSFIRVLVIQNLAADEEVICWSLLIGYFTRNEAPNLRVFVVFFSLTN